MAQSLHAHGRRHSEFIQTLLDELLRTAVCLTFALLFIAALFAGFLLLD